MKILLIGLGSAGDVNPVIVLGKALSERGHRVTLGANDAFGARVLEAGLEFASLGSERDDAAQSLPERCEAGEV